MFEWVTDGLSIGSLIGKKFKSKQNGSEKFISFQVKEFRKDLSVSSENVSSFRFAGPPVKNLSIPIILYYKFSRLSKIKHCLKVKLKQKAQLRN